MPERTWQRTHTHRDSRRQTMAERPSGKSRKLNLNATGCTAGYGQTSRKIESRIKRERERETGGGEFRLYKGQCETMAVNMYVI